MNETQQKLGLLSPICQLGFIVPNLKQAIAHYEPLFGSFLIREVSCQGVTATYRGKSEDFSMRMAIADSGDLEIELIEWVSGECPFKTFIQAGGNGMHHVSFRVANVEATIKAAAALGYTVDWYQRFNDEIAVAYIVREGDPLELELSERPWSGGNVRREGYE